MLWPLRANFARLVIATGGGWLALQWSGNPVGIFIALALALVVFGVVNAAAVAAGVWFRRKDANLILPTPVPGSS